MDQQDTATNWPFSMDPDLSVLDFSSLTSLAIYNIGSARTSDFISGLLPLIGKQIRILRLGFTQRKQIPSARGSRANVPLVSPPEEAHYSPDFIFQGILSTGTPPLKLHTLEILGPVLQPSLSWMRAIDFHTVREFSLIDNKNWNPLTGRRVINNIWEQLGQHGVNLKSLKTNLLCPGLEGFVQTFTGLECLYLLGHYVVDSTNSTLFHPSLTLTGYFHSLRRLFLGSAYEHEMGCILRSCSQLEELAIPTVPFDSNKGRYRWEEYTGFRLKSLHILERLREFNIELPPTRFIRSFYNEHGRNFSFTGNSLLATLERISYARTIWEMVPTDLTASEVEEMEYEFSYEAVPEEDLSYIASECRDFVADQRSLIQWMHSIPSDGDGSAAGGTTRDESTDGDTEKQHVMSDNTAGLETAGDNDDGNASDAEMPYTYCRPDHCYEPTRVFSGCPKMPVKASWHDFGTTKWQWQ